MLPITSPVASIACGVCQDPTLFLGGRPYTWWGDLAITMEFPVVTRQWRGLLPTGADLCCPSCPRLTLAS